MRESEGGGSVGSAAPRLSIHPSSSSQSMILAMQGESEAESENWNLEFYFAQLKNWEIPGCFVVKINISVAVSTGWRIVQLDSLIFHPVIHPTYAIEKTGRFFSVYRIRIAAFLMDGWIDWPSRIDSIFILSHIHPYTQYIFTSEVTESKVIKKSDSINSDCIVKYCRL